MKKFIPKFKDIYVLVLLLILSLVINHSWLSFDIFAFSDYRFLFSDTLKDYAEISSWFSRVNFGWSDPLLSKLPRFLLYSIFGKFGADINIVDKFFILWMWAGVSVTASYLLVKKLTDSTIGGILGSFIFSYNTYFLSINSQGHLPISIASAFGVLSLYFLVSMSEKKNFKYVVYCASSLFLAGMYEIRIVYLFALIFLLYFSYNILLEKRQKVNFFLTSLKKFILVFTILVALNLYWILPLVAGGSLQTNLYLDRSLFGDQFWSLRHASLLFFPFWSGAEPTWFVVNTAPVNFYLFPLFALIGFLWTIKDKNVVFFGVLALIGIVLANQSNPPFGQIYVWLYENFPGFNAFREASKFYIFIAIGYSVLIGSFAARVESFKSKKSKVEFLKFAVIVFVIGICFVIVKPILTNEIGSMHEKRHLPEEYRKLNDFIVSQDEYFRILSIPRESQWLPQITRNHPIVTFAFNNNWDRVFVDFSDNRTLGSTIIDKTKADFFNNLLDQSSIKYVIIPSDDGSFHYYGENRKYYIDEINKLDFFNKIDLAFGEVAVYENENYRPHIYLTNNSEDYREDQPFIKVNYERVKPSEYIIHLTNITEVVYLNFVDSYHPKWEVYVNNRTFLSSKNKLPQSFHKENSIGLNSYLIDPEYIRGNYPNEYYNINSAGGIDLKLVLYYQPDDYLILGIILSAVSFSLLGFYLYRITRQK